MIASSSSRRQTVPVSSAPDDTTTWRADFLPYANLFKGYGTYPAGATFGGGPLTL
jgi:hypothetical protein